jgi:hypothetical protein
MILFLSIICFQLFYSSTAPFYFFSNFKNNVTLDRIGDEVRYRDTIVFALLNCIITSVMLYFLVYYGKSKNDSDSDSSQDSDQGTDSQESS